MKVISPPQEKALTNMLDSFNSFNSSEALKQIFMTSPTPICKTCQHEVFWLDKNSDIATCTKCTTPPLDSNDTSLKELYTEVIDSKYLNKYKDRLESAHKLNQTIKVTK